MCLQKYRRILFFIVLLLQSSIKFVFGFSSYENGNLYQIKQNSTKMKLSEFLRQKHVLRSRTVSAIRDHTIINNSEMTSSYKKWQVGRISRKQYEIINMLWRKTNEFVDVSTNKYNLKQTLPLLLLPHSKLTVTSTPSFIEFYYLDDTVQDYSGKTQKYPLPREEKLRLLRNNYELRNARREHPIFAFHVNDPNYVSLAVVPIKHSQLYDSVKRNFNIQTTFKSSLNNQLTLPINTLPMTLKSPLANYFTAITSIFSKCQAFIDNQTYVYTTQPEIRQSVTNNISNNFNKSASRVEPVSTKAYDKIKFFELYDKNTPLIYNEKTKSIVLKNIDHVVNGNNINLTLSDHPRHNVETQDGKRMKAKHSKKHITESNKYNSENMTIISKTYKILSIKRVNSSHFGTPNTITSTKNTTYVFRSAISRIAEWSENSFMAAYIYEPSQVHCDAASISLHWLITSGSCLSRRHQHLVSEDRSAFVVYCNSHWWAAERVAYVKYSVVHPRFHQRDTKRKHMYNIGLIQVVISMNTCPGWAPISLMSHRYITGPGGSLAYAIGWGLDRYDTRYSSADLPKFPLMKFVSNVYSDSCPGNYGYLRAKHLYEDSGVKNVYCISLPPYEGEARDPIHGSMLIVGGQLCAIYLQEERRPSGEQSARYTGIWRLGPWVMSVAREPDEAETFKVTV